MIFQGVGLGFLVNGLIKLRFLGLELFKGLIFREVVLEIGLIKLELVWRLGMFWFRFI